MTSAEMAIVSSASSYRFDTVRCAHCPSCDIFSEGAFRFKGWFERRRDCFDHSSTAQSPASLPASSSQKGSWKSASGEGTCRVVIQLL